MSRVNSLPEVLTLAEAAKFLRVSTDAVINLVATGEVPARHIDGEWRFLKACLVDWLRAPDGRTRMLQAAGALADDDTLPELLASINRQRRRPRTTRKAKA